jgi:hypothetical protein
MWDDLNRSCPVPLCDAGGFDLVSKRTDRGVEFFNAMKGVHLVKKKYRAVGVGVRVA